MKDEKGNFVLLPVRKRIESKELRQLLPRWMDNTSPSDLGIVRFGFELFPNTLDRRFGTSDWVRPTLYKVLRYYPGITKIERAWAICIPREFSKSTWMGKILPLYFTLVGQYGIYFTDEMGRRYMLPETDYIRTRGKNKDKAEEKFMNIAMELSSDTIIRLFGNLQPTIKEVKDKRLKSTGKQLILNNGYILQAQGMAQASRGANIRDKRPKLDINDDVEDTKNTLTDRLRTKNATELLGDQFGGLADDGLTIFIGNFVHQEGLMPNLMRKDSGWNTVYYQATYIDETGVEKSIWEKRWTADYIRRLGEWYKNMPKLGGWRTFRKEYYNEIVSDKEIKITDYEGSYYTKNNMNFIKMADGQNVRVHTIVSIDPAISTAERSSDGALTVNCFGEDEHVYVHDVSLAKFDIIDRYRDELKAPRVLARTFEEKANISRVGLCSETIRKVLQYNAQGIVIENAGQQLAWINDIKAIIKKLKEVEGIDLTHIPILPYHPVDKKDYKLEFGLMNYIAADQYRFNKQTKHYSQVVSQVLTFPDGGKDLLDTLFNARQMKKTPGQYEQNTFGDVKEKNKEDFNFPKDVEPWVLF